MPEGVKLRRRRARLIAILRRCPPENLLKVAEAAASAGVRAIEVTFDSEDPQRGISALRSSLPSVAIGAGTVMDESQVDAALKAGAEFIVSPITDGRIIERAHARGLFCIPGASTPTEIATAMALGADAVKVFPADSLGGPAFVRAVLTPLGSVPLVPTGGVTANNGLAYLEAGAAALGIGSYLFPPVALRTGDVATIADRAEALMALL